MDTENLRMWAPGARKITRCWGSMSSQTLGENSLCIVLRALCGSVVLLLSRTENLTPRATDLPRAKVRGDLGEIVVKVGVNEVPTRTWREAHLTAVHYHDIATSLFREKCRRVDH